MGWVMSPRLFDVYMDGVVREVNDYKIFGRRLELVGRNGEDWKTGTGG